MNELFEIIARAVREEGVISFARFMELALYCPVYGYYEKEGDNVGRAGDYYTSASVGSLFGELLAFQFADWLAELRRRTADLAIAEAAAHRGVLAGDILSWLREHRPSLYDEVSYCIVEPSLAQRRRQHATLAGFREKVCWVSRPDELSRGSKAHGFEGILFSNELLDAMPVHRLGWDAKRKVWFEWGVMLRENELVWSRMPPGRGMARPVLPRELSEVLPDGFTTEVGSAAERWWREAAQNLRRGRLVTIDYGLEAEDFFAPERREGTLRAFYRHHPGSHLLAHPGEQDITAHVNWTSLRTAGEAAGLHTDGLVRQETFLTQLAARVWESPVDFSGWTPAQNRQFRTLTYPEHLGRAFRVLIQSRFG